MAQFARPDADTSVGNWSASSGTNRYAMIDESSTDDSDYISVTDNFGSSEAITFSLSSVTDPASGSTHSVVVRASEDMGMGAVTLNVNLKDGGTSIKNQDFNPGSSAGNHTMTLSTAQANNISSSGYGDLTLVLTATDGSGMGTTTTVYQAYFTCPDASASTALPMAMNTYKQLRY